MVEIFADLGPMTTLGLVGLLVVLVLVIRSILEDFRIAKDPQLRLHFMPKEFEKYSLVERHKMADWYYRYSSPKAVLGLLLVALVMYFLR